MHQQQQQQQLTYQQFPNFTHPPPTIEQSYPPIDDSTIENFLIDRNHVTIQVNEEKVFNHFEVNGRDRLNVIQMNLNNLIKQQQLEETNLKNNIAQLAPSVWKEKIHLLNQNQIKIAELLTTFETLSSQTLHNTGPLKNRRRNKRKLKKVQQRTSQPKSINCKEVKEPVKRPTFGGDLEESYEKYEVERLRTANLKKIHECKRQLTLLDSLIDLRCIRRKNSNVSGSSKASNEKCFIEQIDQLKSRWTDALVKCNTLENELRMLVTNTSSQLWLNALFSNTEQPSFINETMDFAKLLDIR